MNISVQELSNKLGEIILELGIDPKFKENKDVLNDINDIVSKISRHGEFDGKKYLTVIEENGKISFDYDMGNDHYSVSIFSYNPENLNYMISHRHPPHIEGGIPVKNRNILEGVANIDEKGLTTLTKEYITYGNHEILGPDTRYVNDGVTITSTAERIFYDSEGQIMDRENIPLRSRFHKELNINFLSDEDTIKIARNPFDVTEGKGKSR